MPSDTICASTLNSKTQSPGTCFLRAASTFWNLLRRPLKRNGSTFEAVWMIKLGWLGVGLRMEFSSNGQRFVTTPVSSLQVVHPNV